MRTRSILLTSLVVAVAGCQAADSSESLPATTNATADDATAPEIRIGSEPSNAALTADPEPAQPAPVVAQDGQDAADRVQVRRQASEHLAQQYITHGDELREQLDLNGALQQYAQALQVMPDNEVARDRMRQVKSLMGDDYAQASQFLQDSVDRENVRRVQARLEAEQLTLDGDNYMRLMQYDDAVDAYRRAESILRYNPLIATNSIDEQKVSQKLATAIEFAEKADAEAAAEEAEAARRARIEREEENRTYRENKLRTLYAAANDAFHAENYSLAEQLANQILLYDPGNEHAMQMADIARAARHQRATEENARAYRENWIRTFDELNTMGVPQTDTLEFDVRRWREVRERQPHAFSAGDTSISADKEAVLKRLTETRTPVHFGIDGEGAPLDTVASYLQNVSGVNFVISPAVGDLDEEETSVQLDFESLRSVYSLLNIITETRENLRWKVEDGVVKFVTIDEMVGGQVLRMYEVRDLIRQVSDFPGREININPSGGVPEIDEDLPEREGLVLAEGALESLIRENVAVESWDADPANSLSFSSGTMVVNQTPEVQDMIQRLLDDLREATGIMVDIEARFLKVEDNFLEDIGVDFRGLSPPGTSEFFDDFGDPTAQQDLGGEIGNDTKLGAFYDDGGDGDIKGRTENLYDTFLGDEDALTGSGGLQFQWTYLNDLQLEMVLTAVAKSERVEMVTAPRLLVFNSARSNLSVMNQIAYVHDFDVEIAQGASIADPIIRVVEDGVILDVRPVVSADRRFITLELRPTVAELRRPIRSFTTSLGVSGNGITLQLPELDISRIRTSIPMPDGGTVLLGGMKVHEEQDLRSGIPILNKIPIISFFFERQGTFVTNRKLLVLVKAHIVIPTEHEPSPMQLGLDKTLQLEPR